MSKLEIGKEKNCDDSEIRLRDRSLRGLTVNDAWNSCLHEKFSEQARKNPDAVAIISGTEKYSYQDLDQFSTSLAAEIYASTGGDKTLIGISMERSASVIVGLMGILKAGCAYVPLDPSYPRDRLYDMLDDTLAPIVITTANLRALFSDRDVVTISVDKEPNLLRHSGAYSWEVNPESLAYVIFTSGSTGRPKGVRCLHKGVLNLLSDFQNRQPLGHGDICSWWTSLNFDVSVYEIFSPLIEGATLIVVPDSVRSNGTDLMNWIYENNVTSAYLPPFMVADLDQWVYRNPGKSFLRRLLVGVEPIPEKTLISIDRSIPSIRIINGYGPTETTICATLYSISPVNNTHENTPIGKPVQNMVLRILDDNGKPVRDGDSGELFIGGVGLADGYLNRPELTAERFVKDCLSEAPEARLYRTGDMVRLLDDGNLEFLGRKDFQVKIRGFRVELGEIETLLRGLDAVRESVVMLREDEPGRQQLVAYFVCNRDKSIPVRSMRDHLKKYLPDYMIPSAFVEIEKIPFTPNGKTDREALAPPGSKDVIHSENDEPEGPLNLTETTLLGFFKDLLGIGVVGTKDSFFELGGHSLLAAQLVSRIRDGFGTNIDLSDVFKAPTVRDLARIIESFGSQRFQETDVFVKAGSKKTGNLISFSQMRIWYLDQLEPNTPAYNICLAYRLSGTLNLKALNESVNIIADRHESLRTIFQKSEPDPVRVIVKHQPFSIELVDITNVPPAGREFEASAIYTREAHTGFNLSVGPLFRWLLVKLDDKEHVLLFTIHHIISDGWSMGIIIRELMNLYSKIASGVPISLSPLPFQYSDYALAQTEWMKTDASHSQISYWKQKFRTIPPPMELPTDFPRPIIQSYRGSSQTLVLNGELCQRLKNLGHGENATLFMVLLAGFKSLLFRYTSQTDLCVGTFVANRSRQETEEIVGFFVNTVAIRTELDGDPKFKVLVSRVRDNALGAFANQNVPFEKLLEEIKPERSLSRTPIFQVMMVLQNVPLPDLVLPGLACEQVELKTFRSNFDLTAWVYEVGDQLKIVLEYSSDLFKESTITRMLEHFKILLEHACLDPGCNVSQLEILSEREKDTVLNDWSGGRQENEFPESGVIEMVEKNAKMFPGNLALFDLHGQHGSPVETTYEELNSKTNRLARALQRRGVGSETRVALLLEPFSFMIIGMIGVLKAGGAYVPLDTKYPEKRIEFILNDTASPLVITDQANIENLEQILENFNNQNRPEIICIDRDWKDIGEFSDGDLPQKPGQDQSAYIIYTSGSTGKPKGVVIGHRALATFTRSAVKLYSIGQDDRVLQFASPSFDASVEEIFCSLCGGATLALRSSSKLASVSKFAAECDDAQITVLDLPTAFWQQLTVALEEGSILLPETLRMVIIGGEQPSTERVKAWLQTARPDIRLMNTYGPTEATVVATAVDLTQWRPESLAYRQIPVGRPLDHVRVYILDASLSPTPIGVPGELCIGGNAIALGYLNLPERTAERFVPDPFDYKSDSIIYKTGDRARYLEDGHIEFCGRVDRQVKVRGFRVELDEIDTALQNFPEISEAFSVGLIKNSSPVELISYLVLKPKSILELSDLRETLKRKLPDFMIPSSFVILEKFPLTPGGKIDVKALPDPETSARPENEPVISPRTPVEEVLVNIWQDAFRIQPIGVKDNFFQLGGHSLLSLQIIDHVNKAGLHLSPAEFIQNPTIEGQARVITTAKPLSGYGSWKCLVELQPRGSRPPLYLIHSNPGDVLGYVNLVNRLGVHQPCFGFESLGLRDPSQAHKTVEEMASYYITEMMAFQPEPPYHLAGWCYGGIVAAEMAYQLQQQGSDVGLLALIETPFPRMQNVTIQYYFRKLVGLFKLGPKGWLSYARNKINYLKKMESGTIDSVFSLDLDAGVFANRPQVYRLNTDAMKRYSMKGFLSCPIRIFLGDVLEDGFIPDIEDLWTKMSKNVQRFSAPGSHLTILKEPGASVLAEKLRQCLGEVEK